MTNDDRRYWANRAEAELGRARAASDPAASRAHYELAGLYLDHIHGGEPPEPPRLSLVVAERDRPAASPADQRSTPLALPQLRATV